MIGFSCAVVISSKMIEYGHIISSLNYVILYKIDWINMKSDGLSRIN